MGIIVAIDRSPAIRKFIDQNLTIEGLQVECVAHLEEFRRLSKQMEQEIDMILMEVSSVYHENLDYLEENQDEIQNKNSHIPIILISSSNQKELVVQGVLAGADDFILKPIEKEYFIKKVTQKLNNKHTRSGVNIDGININFNRYISGEIKKAKKGNYKIGFLYIMIENTLNKHVDELVYFKYSEFVFRVIKEDFWDTDVAVRYGSHSLIGIFPFCDEDGLMILESKINNKYKKLQNEQSYLENFQLNITNALFPNDGISKNEIFKKLTRFI